MAQTEEEIHFLKTAADILATKPIKCPDGTTLVYGRSVRDQVVLLTVIPVNSVANMCELKLLYPEDELRNVEVLLYSTEVRTASPDTVIISDTILNRTATVQRDLPVTIDPDPRSKVYSSERITA